GWVGRQLPAVRRKGAALAADPGRPQRRAADPVGIPLYGVVRALRPAAGAGAGRRRPAAWPGDRPSCPIGAGRARAGVALQRGPALRRTSRGRAGILRPGAQAVSEGKQAPVPSSRYSEEIVVRFAGPDYSDFVDSGGER